MANTRVPCCDVRYDFCIKMMFGSSLPPVVFQEGSCLNYVVCVCLHIVVSNTYGVMFFLVLCTLCGSFSGLSIFDSTLWDLFTTKLTNSVDFKPCLTVVLWYSYQHRYYSLQHLLFLFQNLLDLKKIITDNFIYSRVRVMVFNTTFNNISAIYWRSVLLDEETGVR